MPDAVNVGSTPISELTGTTVATVQVDADLCAVADALVAAGVGALLVTKGDDVVGIVSERDLVGALAARQDLATTHAGDVCNTGLVWCDVEATVAEVAGEMMDRYVRHVLVEEDGHLVGIVSARDVLGLYASADAEEEADVS